MSTPEQKPTVAARLVTVLFAGLMLAAAAWYAWLYWFRPARWAAGFGRVPPAAGKPGR